MGNRMEKKKAKGRTLNNKNNTMKNTARRVGAPGVRGLEANPRERRRGVNPEHDNRKCASRSYLIDDLRSTR
jgi:hypothetical protein